MFCASRWRKEKEKRAIRKTEHAACSRSCRVSAQAGGLMADLADLAEAALGFGGAPACDPPTGTPAAAPRRPQVGQGVARFVKPRRFQKPDRRTYLTVLPVSPPSSSAKLSTRHGSSAARAPALFHEREGRSILRMQGSVCPLAGDDLSEEHPPPGFPVNFLSASSSSSERA
jgi:hypothetical protein